MTRHDNGVSITDIETRSFKLSVISTAPLRRVEVTEGWQSLHYLEKSSVPVLEVEIGSAGQLMTEVTWPA